MNTGNTFTLAALAALLTLSASAWAAEGTEHTQHHPAPAASAAPPAGGGSMMDKMESRMAKAGVAIDHLSKKMAAVKGTLERARQASGEERGKLLTQHGQGLQEVLTGLRELTLKMMSKEKMAEMMGGMAPPSEGNAAAQGPTGHEGHGGSGGGQGGATGAGGMMGQGGMAGMDMEGHRETMEKRLILLFDLMEQMMAHGELVAAR